MWLLKVSFAYILFYGIQGANASSDPSIIIVGSGPAGIAAATRLLKNNFINVKILEAENRIGGRINSTRFGNAYVDLGAEFCHGQDGNIVYSMVKDLDILKHSSQTDNSKFFISNGQLLNNATKDKITNFIESLTPSNITLEGCENIPSIGECLDIKSNAFIETSQDANEKNSLSLVPAWAKIFLRIFYSTFDLNDLKLTTQYEFCSGDNNMHWNGLGYKTILEVMMQKFPNASNQLPIDDKIFLEKEVTKISNWQDGDVVKVATADGSTYEADHVIFTPSVGVLKADHEHLFIPILPEEKIEAIQGSGFGAIAKVIMHFPEKWWQDDADWLFIWTDEDKEKLKKNELDWLEDLTGFESAENNPNTLIAWYAGKFIPLIETLADEKIVEGHTYLINTFLKPHFNITTLPDKIIRTRWYHNPHFRGTYTYESVKGHLNGKMGFPDKLSTPLANKNGKLTVLFAGEATSSNHFSTVHGAIETGYREAERLIKLYKN